MESFDLPYRVSGISGTSSGDLAMVQWHGTNAGIFSTTGELKQSLNVLNANELYDITSKNSTLFITDYRGKSIHVIREYNFYVKAISVTNGGLRRLSVEGNTIWFTAYSGLFRVTFDSHYNVTGYEHLVERGSQFDYTIGLLVLPTYIVVGCYYTHNIHFFHHNGTAMFPAVGGLGSQLYYPLGIVADSCMHIYVADLHNNRIVQFSETGQVTRNLITGGHGLTGEPYSLFLHGNIMYITNDNLPYKLFVAELI